MKVELVGMNKSFGPVHANDDIHLNIPPGTIQGILGENGAGKSTLMKILSGFIQADTGEILLDSKPVIIHSPADSIRLGVGMLHQDPLDFPPMSVLDNFLAGSPQEAGKATLGLFPDRAKVAAEFSALEKQFDFDLDSDRHVDELTVGERQQLEILRLLWLGARVLILDEPTTGISALQKDKLFETLRLLASQGKTVIFVSHKLEDVEKLCSRVAVLRRGRLVGEATPPYDIDNLVTLMFGKSISLGSRQDCRGGDSTALELRQFTLEDFRTHIGPVDASVCQGEVIGLAGMEGSGQRNFLRACAGLIRPVGGRILLNGKDLTGRGYHVFQRNGAAYLPASRLEEGLIPGLSLAEHVVLAEEQDGLFVDWDKAQKQAQNRIQDFNIRGTPGSPVESLSGGNQQRALLALLRTPLALILMEHPTRGLDVESSIYIWNKLKERCRQNTAILFISADLDEILLYSDRILVFFAGRVSQPLDASQTSVDQLGQLIGGKGW